MRFHLGCGIMHVGQSQKQKSLMSRIAESATRLDNRLCTNNKHCLILLTGYKSMYVFG